MTGDLLSRKPLINSYLLAAAAWKEVAQDLRAFPQHCLFSRLKFK